MASGSGNKLNILPIDVAEEIKKCAEAAAQSTANERFGSKGEADAQKVYWNEHAAEFTKKADGLLSKNICGNIQYMFWFQAWRTANERKGYRSDAKNDIKKVDEYQKTIKSQGEISDDLADNIRNMGWNIAWYWANTLYGYKDDAKRDKAKLEADYRKIHGEVKLVDVKFDIDKAKVLQEKPKMFAANTLPNHTDLNQSMSYQFKTTQGSTTSVSTTIGFEFSVTESMEVGFEGIGKFSVGITFKLSSSTTFARSMSEQVSKSYSFPLVVPPHTTYIAEAMVHEATMDVPYELVFDFGGTKRTIPGVWKGVAVSSATYKVSKA